MPRSWVWAKNDLTNLKDIHEKFGTMILKTYPELGFLGLVYLRKVKGIQTVPFLNYLDYNREIAKQFPSRRLDGKTMVGSIMNPSSQNSIKITFYQENSVLTKERHTSQR